MNATRETWRERLRGVLPGIVLALAALLTWWPRASAWGIAGGMAGALAGALAGERLGATRLRSWVVPVGAVIGSAAVLEFLHLAGLAPVPGQAPWPEIAATVRDACILFTVSAGAALVLTFLAARFRIARVLPVAALALAAAALLAPHRAGAINRPQEIADLAWLRGWHPVLLLTIAGALAALAATIALVRPRGSGPAWLTLLLCTVLAVLIVIAAPGIGLFQFPLKDPLGLSGKPHAAQGPGGGRADDGARQRQQRGRNPLGLEAPDGGGGGAPSETVPFLDDYTSDGNQVPVAVVVLHDDVQPSGGVLYFRQLAFSSWNGRRLVRSFTPGVDTDIFDGFAPTPIEKPAPVSSDIRQPVPATVSLIRDHVQPPVLADGERIEPQENADSAVFRRTYDTSSEVLVTPLDKLFQHAAGNPHWSPEVRAAYLEVPPDPRYRQLADEILASLRPQYRGDPWARALAVALWLQKNTRYSLRSHHAAADDPTASYLFGDRIGYCVHLSHAATFLVRALGVPARVAAGYAYEAQDRSGGSALLLRSGDAHAWAEVYLDGVGWVPLDPSPPSLDPPTPAPDLDLQRLLGEMARTKTKRMVRDAEVRMAYPSLAQLLAGALALALVSIGTGHAIKGWRRVAPHLARNDRSGRTAYRASLDRLAEAGLARRHGETREAFAARAGALAPSFERLTAAHLGAHFGHRACDPRAARRLAGDVAREVAAGAGRRRYLGLLAPYRWLRSR